ncbi:MAG: PEP-CTERM sorting domain-containing protein [Pirellulaceae bacterium]
MIPRSRFTCVLFCCVAVCSCIAGPVKAQLNFTGGANGFGDPNDFNHASSWGGAGVPNPGTFVNFSLPGSYDVFFYGYQPNGESGNANFSNGTANVRFFSDKIWSVNGHLNVSSGGTVNLFSQSTSNPSAVNVTGDSFFGFTGVGNGLIGSGMTLSNSGAGWIGFHSGSSGTVAVNGTWNNGLDLTVGNNAGTGLLTINSGALVTNAQGYVGRDSLSTGTVNVSGQWINAGSLRVGHNGNGTLNVLAGGNVSNTIGFVGQNSGSSGSASVTGPNAAWINSDSLLVTNGTLNVSGGGRVQMGNDTFTLSGTEIVVSGTGTNGFLNVSNGSTVSNTGSAVLGGNAPFSGLAIVTGANSQWNNSGSLTVGDHGSGTLNVVSGGFVSNSSGYVGRNTGSSGVVTVTGANSQWNNSSLWVGYYGSGTLNVVSGGIVNNSYGYVGVESGSGVVTVTGAGSQWNNSASLDVGMRGDGTLNIESGGVVNNTFGYVGTLSGSTGVVTVTGVGSQWNNTSTLLVGREGFGSLSINAGGVVSSASGRVGNFNGSTGVVAVTGAGSQWINATSLTVGNTGTGTLDVIEAGRVQVGNDSYTAPSFQDAEFVVSGTGSTGVLEVNNGSSIVNIGRAYVGANANFSGMATVSGANSQWFNSSTLFVGYLGDGSLRIEAGGSVSNDFGYIGFGGGSMGDALVTGANSRWLQTGNFYVGNGNGSNGTLRIEDGGSVTSFAGNIGTVAGSTGTATVSGVNSRWDVDRHLYIGFNGNGTLQIDSGGMVTNLNGQIGYLYDSTGAVTVTGAGSQWINSDELSVGYEGNGTLQIVSGGLVSNRNGYIGRVPTRGSGIATVTGAGSQWVNSDAMFMDNGTLEIADQGRVQVGDDSLTQGVTEIIVSGSGTKGILTVRGGSTLTNSGNAIIGGAATFSGAMNIQSGGVVNNTSGLVGRFAGSTGTVTLNGTGSQWNNPNGVAIGVSGTGTLNIEAGGSVTSSDGFVGYLSGSTGTATVSGIGSQWINSNSLYVGLQGDGSLMIEEGGLVTSNTDVVIGHTGSTGQVTVTGTGSKLDHFGNLFVGLNSGTSGLLNIEAGGSVSNQLGLIGRSAGSSGSVLVTGAGSHWNQSDSLFIGGNTVSAGGTGSVVVENDAFVEVAGMTKIWDQGSLMIDQSGMLDTTTLDLTLGSFQMQNGGILMAENVLGDLVNESGIFAPGSSPGITTISGSYSQGETAWLDIELGGLLPGEYDQLLISGDLNLDGFLTVSLFNGFNLNMNQQFLIADVTGTTSGIFAGLNEGDLVGNFGGLDLFISYSAGDGNDVALFTAVPEPGSAALLVLLSVSALLNRRRRCNS